MKQICRRVQGQAFDGWSSFTAAFRTWVLTRMMFVPVQADSSRMVSPSGSTISRPVSVASLLTPLLAK